MKNPEGMSIKLCNKWKETALTYHMIKKSWRNSFKKKFLISKDKLVKISMKIKHLDVGDVELDVLADAGENVTNASSDL